VSTALHKDPAVIEHGAALLAGMKDVCPSLLYAALLTDDGFEVVRLARTDRDGGRFASMASSMQALSDAVARELSIGMSEYTIIASASGHVVQLRVPGHALVLSSLFDDDETLGKALAISRQTAERMAGLLTPVA
jgi:predicted regulator of Ras-like GTPase activity (Roadblock/LC7/MglB family)